MAQPWAPPAERRISLPTGIALVVLFNLAMVLLVIWPGWATPRDRSDLPVFVVFMALPWIVGNAVLVIRVVSSRAPARVVAQGVLGFGKCDVCGAPLDASGCYRIPTSEFAAIVRRGYDPFGEGGRALPNASLVLPLAQAQEDDTGAPNVHSGWARLAAATAVEHPNGKWGLCAECAQDAARFAPVYGICEKCGERPGVPYMVLYGHGQTETIGGPYATHWERSTTTYEGERQVLICEACVEGERKTDRSAFRYATVIGVLLALVGLALAMLDNPWFWLLFGLGIFVVLVGVFGLAESRRPDQFFGERLALRLAKPTLKRAGYNVVTTETEIGDKARRSVQ